jgi:hypothetical protein
MAPNFSKGVYIYIYTKVLVTLVRELRVPLYIFRAVRVLTGAILNRS